MVFTFFTPFEKERTCAIIKTTILTIGGDFRDRSDGCFVAKWRAPKFHTILPTKFTFYVGDGLVRAVSGAADMQTITTQLKLWGILYVWDHFVSNLLRLYPNTDFGIKPGIATIVAAEFVGDATEEVMVSRTDYTPSISGAIVGGKLFGAAGAIIGSSYGSSQTTTRYYTRFSDSILTRVRYSNGLLAEGTISRKSSAFHEITVNMQKLSDVDTFSQAKPREIPVRDDRNASLEIKNAIKAAQSYLSSKYLTYSRKELVAQLEHDGYDVSAAESAIDHLIVDWNEQAAQCARDYMNNKSLSFSPKELIEQLEHEGFTPDQVAFGVKSVGY